MFVRVNVSSTYVVSRREVGELAHDDVDGDLDVVGVEVVRGLAAAEQVYDQLQHGVRRRRLVVEDMHRVLCNI